MPGPRVISTMMKPEELLNYLTSSTHRMFQIIQQGKEIIMMMKIFSHRLKIHCGIDSCPMAPSSLLSCNIMGCKLVL